MYSNRALLRDIWAYVRPYKKDFWIGTVSRVISDISWLYIPYATAFIVGFFTNYAPGESLKPIYIVFSLLMVAVIVRHWFAYNAKTRVNRTAERVVMDAQLRALKHLFLLDIDWHEKQTSGSRFKRIDRGSISLGEILRFWVNNLIEIGINLIGVIFILFKFDRTVGMLVVIFLLTYYLLAHHYRSRAKKAAEVVNMKEEVRSGLLFEAIHNIRSIKVMSMSMRIISTLLTSADDLYIAIKNRIFWYQYGNFIRNTYGYLFRNAILAFIVYEIIQGKAEIAFLVLFLGYFERIWISVAELADVAQNLVIAKVSVQRMQAIMETPVTIDSEIDKIKFASDWKKMALQNVSFSYGDNKVLDNVSFEVKRGEKVGIVGLSGAGKSTLFKLLLKEYESYEGDITFDETHLKWVSKKDYFNHMAVVLQETELFNASLRENITITNQKEEKNEQLLSDSIEISHVKDFMDKLPQGVDSIIGEKGVKLSGGEKQRVGIARAVFKQPQILLLDEATSHLDIESEDKIRDSLHKFFQNVTAVVIAHRLTTIKEMDKIIVLEGGKVIEQGSFTQLRRNKGRFHELWEKQKISK